MEIQWREGGHRGGDGNGSWVVCLPRWCWYLTNSIKRGRREGKKAIAASFVFYFFTSSSSTSTSYFRSSSSSSSSSSSTSFPSFLLFSSSFSSPSSFLSVCLPSSHFSSSSSPSSSSSSSFPSYSSSLVPSFIPWSITQGFTLMKRGGGRGEHGRARHKIITHFILSLFTGGG